MEVGSSVRTPDGTGTITGMDARSAKVQTGTGSKWYELDTLDMIYDPIAKMCKKQIDDCLQFATGIDAHRLYTEYRFNPYVLAASTKIKIFPHQINEVMWGLENPRIMIADEVGLGKTIIAALIVSELRARGTAKRLLFVVPKSLQIKWKIELEQRFDIPTKILNSEYVKNNPEPFEGEFSFVASMDYLKQEHIISRLNEEIDVVVVDEAHKMKKGTSRLKLGEHLASKTDTMILLTATPHDGRDEDFMARMNMLDSFVSDIRTASYLWTRTTKEDVVDIEGKKVFPDRTSKTVDIALLNKERDVIKLLEGYFDHIQSNVKTPREENMIRFLRHIYRKRASSSLHSLGISLRRRIDKLGTADTDIESALTKLDYDYSEDIEFEDIEGYEGFTISDVEREKEMLTEITKHLEQIGCDSKLDHLRRFIKTLKEDRPDAKLVLFTEYRDTLDYLAASLDYEIGKIDGTMSITERQDELEKFKKSDGYEVMLCTDAAGEGIDMQFCNVEINYDLPWNPNRLEQRMGRIHRIGQDQNVFYYNFVVDSKSSIDGYIMQKLLEKIEQIKAAMGDKVYDVVGSLIGSEEFGRYYDELRKIPRDQWEPKIAVLMSAIEAMRYDVLEKRKMLLEGNRLDSTKLEDIQKIRNTAIVIDEVKRFLQVFVETNGGRMNRIDSDKELYSIRLSERHSKELGLGEIVGTFDGTTAEKESYEYLALGNHSIEKILRKAASDHVASLGHESQEGVLCIYKITITDGQAKQRDSKIIAIFEQSDGVIYQVDERSVWTYKQSDREVNIDFATSASKRIETIASSMAQKQKESIDRKLREIKKKTKTARNGYYAKKISDIKVRMGELQQNDDGPHVERIIDERKRKIKTLEKQADIEYQKLDRQFNTATRIDLIGIAQVTADDGADIRIRIDEAGMKAVLESERKRAPDEHAVKQLEDCSKKNCGYDVVSFDRKIEVKSHKKSGSIMLTDHEWKTAERLQDEYWLYVVEYVFENPHITAIQNPASKFHGHIEKIPAKQFRWVIHDWKERST